MPTTTVLTSGLDRPVGLRVGASGRLYVAEQAGPILAIDAASGISTPLANAPGRISVWDLSPDERTAFVAGGAAGLRSVPLDGSPATLLARFLVPVGAVRCGANGNAVRIAESRPNGRLLERQIAPPAGTVIARRLNRAHALVIETLTGRNLVAQQADGGQLVVPGLAGPPAVVSTALGEPVDLAWEDATETHLLVADRAGGRVLRVDPAGVAPPVELLSGVAGLWAAQPLGANRFAIGADDQVLIVDDSAPPAPVVLTVPDRELFISSWTMVDVVINDPAIMVEDIEFHIKPDDSGALVSLSRDNSYDPAQPKILVSAGWLTGEHLLIAMRRSDGSLLAEQPFNVLDTWTDPNLGPSLATFGEVVAGPTGSTWGGPDSGDFTVPQNISAPKALGTRQIGVVLVDTASANGRYPTGAGLTTIINDLRDELINGVLSGGQTRSVRQYFREASDGRFDINLVGIAGPINLPNAFGSYFTEDKDKKDKPWSFNEDTDSTIIAAVIAQNEISVSNGNPPVLDLNICDSIIFVVRTVPAPPMGKATFAWPRARTAPKSQLIGTRDLGFVRIPTYRGIGSVFMPDDWAAQSDREFHETASHELGHNLGLQDQYNKSYTDDIAKRITAQDAPAGGTRWSWELMSWEQALPMPSAAHRLMLGWIDPADVQLFNFGVAGPVDRNVVLQAASAGRPTLGSNRKSAAEVRIEDGKNYYFEYRASTPGRIVDTAVPEALAVLGTEALTREAEPAGRAQILLVQEDKDAVVEQGSFVSGQDYREFDTSTPNFQQEFIVDVVSTTADTATLRVRYAPDDKPDPGMTPWSPSTNWQSPDIQVSNARSQADPSLANVPWEGHDNTLTATVTNHGTSDAHGVTVRFFSKDFTFGGGNEVLLGEAAMDVPAKQTRTFTCPNTWKPTVVKLPFGAFEYEQHACVVARMEPFLDPVTNIWEVTPENNEAQSNYTWMASTTRSPATRELTTIIAENPFDKPAIIAISVNQPHPLFRVYLDHRWVRLDPGESQRILLMTESLLGDPLYRDLVDQINDREHRIETTLRLSALGDTRETCADSVIGGVSVRAMTGVGTMFRRFEVRPGVAFGMVAQADTGDGVNGPVLVTVRPPDPQDPRPEITREANAIAGEFRVELGDLERGDIVQAHYLGLAVWMPCDSEQVNAP